MMKKGTGISTIVQQKEEKADPEREEVKKIRAALRRATTMLRLVQRPVPKDQRECRKKHKKLKSALKHHHHHHHQHNQALDRLASSLSAKFFQEDDAEKANKDAEKKQEEVEQLASSSSSSSSDSDDDDIYYFKGLPRFPDQDIDALKVCYHQNHEAVRNVWTLHRLLEDNLHISISPPFLAYMLEKIGIRAPCLSSAGVVSQHSAATGSDQKGANGDDRDEIRQGEHQARQDPFTHPPQIGEEDPYVVFQETNEHFFISELQFIHLVCLIRYDEASIDAYLDTEAQLLDLAYSELDPNERGCISSDKLVDFLNNFALAGGGGGKEGKRGAPNASPTRTFLGGALSEKEISLKKLTGALYKQGHSSSGAASAGSRLVASLSMAQLARRSSLPNFDDHMMGYEDPGSPQSPSPLHENDATSRLRSMSLKHAHLLLPAIEGSGGNKAGDDSQDKTSPSKKSKRVRLQSQESPGKITMMSRNELTASSNDRVDFSRSGIAGGGSLNGSVMSRSRMNSMWSQGPQGMGSGTPSRLGTSRVASRRISLAAGATPLDFGGLASSAMPSPGEEGLELDPAHSVNKAALPPRGAMNRSRHSSMIGGGGGGGRRVSMQLSAEQLALSGLPPLHSPQQNQSASEHPIGTGRSVRSRAESMRSVRSRSDSLQKGGNNNNRSTSGNTSFCGSQKEGPFHSASEKGLYGGIDSLRGSAHFGEDYEEEEVFDDGGGGGQNNGEAQEDALSPHYVVSEEGGGSPTHFIDLSDLLEQESQRMKDIRTRSRPWLKKRHFMTEEQYANYKKRKRLVKKGIMTTESFREEVRKMHLHNYPTYFLLEQTSKRMTDEQPPPIERAQSTPPQVLQKEAEAKIQEHPNLALWMRGATPKKNLVQEGLAAARKEAASSAKKKKQQQLTPAKQTRAAAGSASSGAGSASTPAPTPTKKLL